jgi:hypothetical protein
MISRAPFSAIPAEASERMYRYVDGPGAVAPLTPQRPPLGCAGVERRGSLEGECHETSNLCDVFGSDYLHGRMRNVKCRTHSTNSNGHGR